MFLQDGDEAIAVRGLNEVGHFMDDHILKKIFGFFHQLGVETNVPPRWLQLPHLVFIRCKK